MILDFGFQQIMRLSSVKRWGVVEMSRQQSVAEHSYNVSMISLGLARKIDVTIKMNLLLEWALVHDLPEVMTGDVPSSLKTSHKSVFTQLEGEEFPKYTTAKNGLLTVEPIIINIVKIADYVDAIQFARKFCVDSRKYAIIAELIEKMWVQIKTVEFMEERGCGLGNVVKDWLGLKVS